SRSLTRLHTPAATHGRAPRPDNSNVRWRVQLRAVAIAILLMTVPVAAAQRTAGIVATPASHFGFRIGDDGRLATADAIENYFEAVAATSDRVKIADLGPTTDGHRTIAAIISSAENIRNLEQIRRNNQRLSDPRTLDET